jgi:ADP-ribose pyrophosphatase YjhB (NUDIX family)
MRDDHVLLSRGDNENFWTLPGGHIEPGEMSDQALLREVAEELGVANIRLDRLIWIVENRFIYQAQCRHEVGFYYLAELPADALPISSSEFAGFEPGVRFRWFPVSEITDLDIRPRFLRERMSPLPDRLEHLQVDETAVNFD